MLLFHDEAIFSYLIQTYHLMAEEPEKQILEENIESTAQFIYHELWWYQHATEVESSDSQKIKVGIREWFINRWKSNLSQMFSSLLFNWLIRVYSNYAVYTEIIRKRRDLKVRFAVRIFPLFLFSQQLKTHLEWLSISLLSWRVEWWYWLLSRILFGVGEKRVCSKL